MKTISTILCIIVLISCSNSFPSMGQIVQKKYNFPIVSIAPIKYRVNESDGITLHGYYSKNYNLSIYGNKGVIAFRADCDMDEDWSGANAQGTTQSSNSFESKYKCVFNPHELYGTVLPGNKTGQNHFDKTRNIGVDIGDITLTYKVDSKENIIDSIIGVVFDLGPQNQPGESSVASCKELNVVTDNNEYIYCVFPDSKKYLIQIIGLKPNSNKLTRNPTNEDFKKAFDLMKTSETDFKNNRENLLIEIKNYLSKDSIIYNFDNPTLKEKEQCRQMPKNNSRNANY